VNQLTAKLVGFLIAAALLAAPVIADPVQYQPALDDAFFHLYNSDFDGSRAIVDTYLTTHADDPVAYSVKASGFLFSELDRMGILESEFFKDNRRVAGKKQLIPDVKSHDLFYAAIRRAQDLANQSLARNPKDANALFALCLANGDLTDYVALIEKRQWQSLSINKVGYRDAKHLLEVAPDYYDAYLTTGFTDYLIGSIPLVVRFFVRFDDVRGDTQAGLQKLQIVAKDGHYLKSFAKILLATAYLRDKQLPKARALLKELTQIYPQNPLLKRELDRLSTQM
jgi:hypothetical protein